MGSITHVAIWFCVDQFSIHFTMVSHFQLIVHRYGLYVTHIGGRFLDSLMFLNTPSNGSYTMRPYSHPHRP